MNILITGCAGFIASHIAEELLKDSDNFLVGIDNFHSGTIDNINFIKSIDKGERFNFIEADIRNFEELKKIIVKYNIEQIYHLAAIVSVQESIENPLLSHEVNLKGTLNILELSRLNKVKRVVFSSSAAVYGDESIQPKHEESTVKPISPYGYEKLMCEQYMKLYNDLYDVETVCLRYFNVYGERQSASSDYSGVISIFEKNFKNNETINIYGDGEQYRDFVYVKDVVNANIKAMLSLKVSGNIYCVGTAIKTSINDLVTILNRKYKKDMKPIYFKARDGDIKESLCDNNKIKKELAINDFVRFDEGILRL